MSKKRAWPIQQGLPLPPFNAEGLLHPGDYKLTLEELRASSLVLGPDPPLPNWDRAWRAHLVDNLEILIRHLWSTGITEIFVDGSFAEDKSHPNDIDGYFVCGREDFATGELEERLNLLDPWKVWTWDSDQCQPTEEDPVGHLPMWHRYRVDLWPYWGWPPGHDEFGHRKGRPSFFRHTRAGKPRGIIAILPDGETL